jgi:type VI protein secretion system component VasK
MSSAKEMGRRQKLRDYLVKRWNDMRGDANAGAQATQLMAVNVDYYLVMLSKDPTLRFPRDLPVVNSARHALKKVRGMALRLAEIVNDIEQSAQFDSLSLAAIVGPAPKEGPVMTLDFSSVAKADDFERSDRKVIRAAFTREAWEKKLRKMLADPKTAVSGEGWVLGISQVNEEQQSRDALAELRKLYFEAYKSEWKALIDALRVTRPENREEAFNTYRWLAATDPSPIKSLMLKVQENTHLVEEASATAQLGNSEVARTAAELARIRAQQRLASKIGGQAGTQMANALINAGTSAVGSQIAARTVKPDSPAVVETYFLGFTRFGAPPLSNTGNPSRDPTDIDSYEDQLQRISALIRKDLDTHTDSPEVIAQIIKVKAQVNQWIANQDQFWKEQFGNLLNPPLDGIAPAVPTAPSAAPSAAADPAATAAPSGRRRRGR